MVSQVLEQRAGADWPPVVVAGVAQTGLNLMRDLARKGVRVVGVDSRPGGPGFRSIYGRSFACPDPDDQPEAWLDFMRAFAKRLAPRPVLIASADLFVTAVGRHARELEAHYLFAVEAAVLLASLATKDRLYTIAKASGFPCPKTAYVGTVEDLQRFAQTARFPCLLKPRHQREWKDLRPGHALHGQKLGIARTPEQLMELYQSVASVRPEALAQEIVEGPDHAKYVYLSVYGRDGSNLGRCVVRELRSEPPVFGSASIVEPVVDGEIESLCDAFLRGIGYVGICEIELKRDSRDGLPKLIEVNPRITVTGDCASYMGVEVGWLHYLDMIGRSVSSVVPTRFDFRHITLSRDAGVIPDYLRFGDLTWGGLWRSYRRPLAFFDLDLRDFRVSASVLIGCARSLIGTIRRHGPRPEGL